MITLGHASKSAIHCDLLTLWPRMGTYFHSYNLLKLSICTPGNKWLGSWIKLSHVFTTVYWNMMLSYYICHTGRFTHFVTLLNGDVLYNSHAWQFTNLWSNRDSHTLWFTHFVAPNGDFVFTYHIAYLNYLLWLLDLLSDHTGTCF